VQVPMAALMPPLDNGKSNSFQEKKKQVQRDKPAAT